MVKISGKKIKYFQSGVTRWRNSHTLRYPWRTERSKFHALIAEIMLQRTRAEQVVPVFKKFKKSFPAPVNLSKSSSKKIANIMAPLGLRWRSRLMISLGRELQKKHFGRVPKEKKILMSLPGVGQYAASAFLSFHADQRAVLIDSNTVRLYGRFFGFPVHAETRRKRSLALLAERITPVKNFKRFNYAVLDIGRTVCRPQPECSVCPVSKKCRYYQKEMI